MELICHGQKYAWGKVGRDSLVAQLLVANSGTPIEDTTTYAELWMGDHPNGPSKIKGNITEEDTLSSYIKAHSYVLGSKVTEAFSNNLPFLFKVLSVNTALSIQAHPSKKHAEELFAQYPNIYKDNNHKPELAIALTPFQALCGFRPIGEIRSFLDTVPELGLIIPKEKIQRFVDESSGMLELKDCFTCLMNSPESVIKNALQQLLDRLKTADLEVREQQHASLVERIYLQFPDDIGIFCIYWLNYMRLDPGQALFLAANEPHAYLYGDCIECMANSDNVVRAGLTPKYRDVATLCEMLTYECHQTEEILFKSVREDSFTELFIPPVKDFAVAKINVPEKSKIYLKERNSASIIIIISGNGSFKSDLGDTEIRKGSVLFLQSNMSCSIQCDESLLIFQAFCNV